MTGGSARASTVAAAFADHWPTLVARLARRYGDLALAEDCAAEAFAAAVPSWRLAPPDNPGGWLWTAAQRRAIDRLRQHGRWVDRAPLLAAHEVAVDSRGEAPDVAAETDQLALLFGCCHPSLSTEAQVALTLRAVNGLSTEQIAKVFLTRTDTMTRRLTRAKTKLAANAVPFEIPEPEHWSERLAPVLDVIYLTFTSGHTSHDHGSALIRGDACDEARWLASLVARMAPTDPEVLGLSALMDFTDARRAARVDTRGRVVLMADQDRALWDRELMTQGRERLRQALRQRRLGSFQIEAALSACHAMAPTWEDTDWGQILRWYDALVALHPSGINRLNRAVAQSMAGEPAQALVVLESLIPELAEYHYLWVARADAFERLGRIDDAIADLHRALDLHPHPIEAEELRRRIEGLRPRAPEVHTAHHARFEP